jgi:DNA-binding NarL/FixJ family response regulator
MKRPRVLLADDHTIFRQGLARLLESDVEIVGAVEDGRALLALTRKLKPDLLLVDISMPLLNGLDAVRQLKKELPGVRVIFLSVHANPAYAAEAFRLGASGYLLKVCEASELLFAIREVMLGRSYVTPMITKETMELLMSSPKEQLPLTDRQREVLQLLAEGHSTKEVARYLDISVRTVEFHKGRLMEILGIHTRADLVKYAVANGIVSAQ